MINLEADDWNTSLGKEAITFSRRATGAVKKDEERGVREEDWTSTSRRLTA